MNIVVITQARVMSTRLPEKILKEIEGTSLLEIHLKRIQQSKLASKIKVATTNESQAEKIVNICQKLSIEAYQGSVDHVLDRFYQCAVPEGADWIVRLTSDCPLIEPCLIDQVIDYAITHDLDYVSNIMKPTFPDGMDVEVFKFSALEKAYQEASMQSEKEHVTPYIWKNSSYMGGGLFQSDCITNEVDYSSYRLTVDNQEDFEVIKKLVELIGSDKTWTEYVKILEKNPAIMAINQKYKRNEGYKNE